MSSENPRTGLFVTCLVDLFRPSVGFAAVALLERAGCQVVVPRAQTCCGQPAYNAGNAADAGAIARQVIAVFEGFDHVVAPSGSCAAMIKHHYPALLADDPHWAPRARALAERTHELVSFLVDIMGVTSLEAEYEGIVTYHDSCSGLREMSVKDQPRQLLAALPGIHLRELPDAEVCCGFGGTFCIKYPDISNRMLEDKTADILATGADTLLAGDLGCLMNMAGKLHRAGHNLHVRHVAELLAGMCDEPPIGEPAALDPSTGE